MDYISYLIITIGIGLSVWVIIRQKPWWKLTPDEKKKKLPLIIAGFIVIILGLVMFLFLYQFSSPQRNADSEQFTVAIGQDDSKEIFERLESKGFIRNKIAFNIALMGFKGINAICIDCIAPGAYKLSKSMSAWQIAKTLKQGPYMKWVVIPEGLRKEQIAEILAQTLNWDDQQKSDWVTKHTAMKYDYLEGVYFPDTYLIPVNETGLQIAQRFINKFNEKFLPYSDKFLEANIKWDTALKIASITQREASGQDDMPLIAGIIWNRLLADMKLDIDATLQYARDSELAFNDLCHSSGNKEQWSCDCVQEPDNCYIKNGYYQGTEYWWTPIAIEDKKTDSAYNTYLYKGLPPHPIANPGINAIDAVLNPTETNCFYYLHDNERNIHCVETYEEHLENIEKYLK